MGRRRGPGFGEEQPGSWLYNILPFIEEQALHDMPKDGQRDTSWSQHNWTAPRRWFSFQRPQCFIVLLVDPPCLYLVEAHHPEIAVNAKRVDPRNLPDIISASADYAANGGDGIIFLLKVRPVLLAGKTKAGA